MKTANALLKRQWEAAFAEQIDRHAYNTAPVEAVVRNVSYFLRDRCSPSQHHQLRFLEMGCGAGANLVWLAQKGIEVSGVDISPTALELTRAQLDHAGCRARIGALLQRAVDQIPLPDASFDGIIEACVFQHLAKPHRLRAFREVKRLLKPGGLFVGYLLDRGHTVFQAHQGQHLAEDPGTLILQEGRSKLYLTNLGVCHFFDRQEVLELLDGFTVVDPCLTTYALPREEAQKRGYAEYVQSMWTVYAIK